MARAVANKIYKTFVRGLITEANELTYPENASIAEDNTVIFRKGNRSRRLGMNAETNGGASVFETGGAGLRQEAMMDFNWSAVNNDASVNFLVKQVGNRLRFYDHGASPLSDGLKPFEVDLNDYLAPLQSDVSYEPVQMAAGKGFLFVVGEKMEPLLIEYDPDNNTITVQRIYIQTRDFKGLNDGLANDEEPTTLSTEHSYNLRNQGWVDGANTGAGASVQYFDSFGNQGTYNSATSAVITAYFTSTGRYPGNNKQWWSARDATTNDFDPALLAKLYTGNNRAPRGHFVVDAFNIDRSSVSGVAGIPVESKVERPISVAFFSGRVWYLSGSTVYFSQILDDKRKAGFCYQEADPTSEDISELLPNDGGVIQIPEMSKGVRLMPLGSGVIVFSLNGIWSISGTSAGFSAVDISISKINPIGTESPNSVVEAEGQVYWWSRVGILAMAPRVGQFGPVEGLFDKTNISEQTIQTFYQDSIPEDRKPYVKGLFDPATNTIQWLFSDDSTLPNYTYNRILNLDLTLQAFYPWGLDTEFGPLLTGIFLTPTVNVVEHNQIRDSFFKYSYITPFIGSANYKHRFGLFNNTNFADWQDYDGTGVAYLSYCETGYELLEDTMRKKQTPFVYTYFRKTEENYVADGDDYTVDKPSSCYFQVRWDFSNSQISNKFSTKLQAYRHVRLPQFEDADLTFDTGFPIVVTRHKVRGTGKAIQFRFESDEIGKDFDLLGWAVSFQGNSTV